MRKYRATAFNADGLTFTFWFYNENWHSIQAVARQALDEIVRNDPSHSKYGPWDFHHIDIAA
jgi:hypothetical protein